MGMGRGKVGEIVFSRQDGEQVFRARNRHPHNPQTNKQLVQRAIMATVMSAYSAGREIFDHSFQGYSVGAGCQRRFLSLNANALRTQMAIDFDNATPEEALAKVTAPKIQTPIPNQYVVSEGSLLQSLFSFEMVGDSIPRWKLPAPQTNEKTNTYAARVGINAGDIYTFVFILASNEDADILYKTYGVASVSYDTIYRGAFGWVRLIAKNLSAVETTVTNATLLSALFDIEIGGIGTIAADTALAANFDINLVSGVASASDDNGYAIALIKSRRDADLRSNASMIVGNPDDFGIYWNDLLTAWKAGTTQIGESDLILEGGDE